MPRASIATISGCSAWSIWLDDQRRQIRRDRSRSARGSRERHQDLARVVLLAEEPLVEPLPRALAVTERRQRAGEEQQIDDRAAREDLLQRSAATARRRARRRQDGTIVSVRLASAYCRLRRSTIARPEHARHADRVGQPERRQQHERCSTAVTRHGYIGAAAPVSIATIGTPSFSA